MLPQIQTELKRVSAADVAVSLDREFDPVVGTLVKIELGEAYWHMLPNEFLELLKRLPAGAGEEAVRVAVEKRGPFVWHGPAPDGSRDASL